MMLVWFLARQQLSQLDDIFFQPSLSGARGLSLYLIGDYSGAAKAYRAHFQQAYRAGRTTGDPTWDAILRGDLRKAKELSQRTLEHAPEDSAALLNAGEIAFTENDLSKAVESFDRILQEKPDHADAAILASVAYARSGDYDNAIDSLNRALRHSRTGSRPSSFLRLLETTGDKSRLPDGKKPLCLLANYYRYLQIYDELNGKPAIAYAEKAIAAGDRPADAYLAMGIVYEQQAKYDRALAAFLNAIEINPRHAEAYRLAAQRYSDRGDIAQQYTMLKKAFEVAPRDPFYANNFAAFLNDRLGDYHQGLEVALKALQASPEDINTIHKVGLFYHQVGNFETAIQYYHQLIARTPNNPEYYEELGESLLLLGRREQALAAFQQAIKIDPHRAGPHIRMGEYFWDSLQIRKTIAEYEEALRVGGPNFGVFTNLCIAYHRGGEFEKAMPCLEAVLAQDPQNIWASLLIGSARQSLEGKKTP